jgi:putative Holliday junction resolvase
MKCLGMDLGTKTLGLAISDKSGTIASAYKLIRYVDINNLVKEVIEIINKEKVEVLVLGLPKN